MNTNHWEQLAARHHSWLPPTVTAYGRPSDSSNLEDRARSHKPSAGFSEARFSFSCTSQRRGPVGRMITTGFSRHDYPEAVLRRSGSELLVPMFHNVRGFRTGARPRKIQTHISAMIPRPLPGSIPLAPVSPERPQAA